MKIKDIIQVTKNNTMFVWNYSSGADYGYFTADTMESYLLDTEVVEIAPQGLNGNADMCLSISIHL